MKEKSRAQEPIELGGVRNGGSFRDDPYCNGCGVVLGKVEIKIAMAATSHSNVFASNASRCFRAKQV